MSDWRILFGPSPNWLTAIGIEIDFFCFLTRNMYLRSIICEKWHKVVTPRFLFSWCDVDPLSRQLLSTLFCEKLYSTFILESTNRIATLYGSREWSIRRTRQDLDSFFNKITHRIKRNRPNKSLFYQLYKITITFLMWNENSSNQTVFDNSRVFCKISVTLVWMIF